MQTKPTHKNFILQKDHADCGVACLQNILHFYGAYLPAEKIRELSGTDANGTNMLGMRQAAKQAGFEAEGVVAGSVEDLKTLDAPCILWVVQDQRQHYIVVYQWDGKAFLVGDPARGLVRISPDDLEKIWGKKVLLRLAPTDKLRMGPRKNEQRKKWLYPIIGKYLHFLLVAAAFGLVAAILSLSTAVFSQKLVDRLLKHADPKKLFLGIALLSVLLVFRAFIFYVRGWILARQSKGFNEELTTSFYRKILSLPKSFFDNRKTGDMVARLNDTTRIQQTVSLLAGDVSIQVLLLLVSTVALFIYSPIAGCIGLLFIPLVFLVVHKVQAGIINGQKDVMVAYAQNESNYIDHIRGIGIIKLFNREAFFLEGAGSAIRRLQEANFRIGKIRIRFNLLIDLVANLFFTSLVVCGILQVLHQHLLPGELIAILQLGVLLMQTSTAVAMTQLQIQEARVAFDRMVELVGLDAEKESLDMEIPGGQDLGISGSGDLGMERGQEISGSGDLGIISNKGLSNGLHEGSAVAGFEELEMEEVDFRFPGRPLLLRQVSMTIKKGEILALVGESGQGKSTIFQLLQHFYSWEKGGIRVNGRPLATIEPVAWRKTIGVVTQEPALFSGTVIENILLDHYDEAAAERVIEFCRETGLHTYISRLPQGYGTLIGEGGIAISGGQKQLVCLARCLYHDPQLLLLDEPTAAMDRHTEAFVIGLLREWRSRAGIIVISHKDSLTKMADKVYELAGGELQPYLLHLNPVL